ncbi:MAG TPA: carboxymuconolactone decarboxylase family protein [Gemmatimonadales bacterium]|nr:carboxymuconolactone decarboxylase family protein [Gemmatimonadales bacterium]
MGHWHDVISDLSEPTRSLRQAIPDAWSGFAQMHKGAMAEGALSTGVKEIIALAIAVAEECDGCIAYHAKGAARHGATEEEAAEAMGVALLMLGGPATVYGPRAWAAFLEFKEG